MRAVVFERQIEPVAHEFDVALDRLGAHFQLPSERAAIGKAAGLDFLVNAQHPLHGRTGMRVAGVLFGVSHPTCGASTLSHTLSCTLSKLARRGDKVNDKVCLPRFGIDLAMP